MKVPQIIILLAILLTTFAFVSCARRVVVVDADHPRHHWHKEHRAHREFRHDDRKPENH